MTKVNELSPEALSRRTDPGLFSFETTQELEDFQEIIGQPRAIEAIRFGIGMEKDGFNLFALGPAGAGKRSLVRQFFDQQAAHAKIPDDWCYVHNFEHDHKPNAIRMPAGKGIQLQQDMALLVEELRTAISSAFESDEYRARRQVAEEDVQQRQEKVFEDMQEKAKVRGLSLLRTPAGLVFAPMRNGEVMHPDEFQKLPQGEREQLEKSVAEMQEQLQKTLQLVPVWQREVRKKVQQLDREITSYAVGGLINELKQKYVDFPQVIRYFDAVQKDVVENSAGFRVSEDLQSEGLEGQIASLMARNRQDQSAQKRYQVNLLVDHHMSKGAPVIFEDNPTYQNLIGRVEHVAQMGALLTDFTLIKPGALHLANGGYLILDVRKVLEQPYAWEALKRALLSRRISVESVGQMLSLVSTVSLEPEPIPLDVKVALLGDRWLYYLLALQDPEFNELFKVQADFEEQMDRNPDNQILYSRVIGTLVMRDGLRPFHREAVARVIEHSARLAGDAEKLSIQVKDIVDLLREADYWAGQREHPVVLAEDVEHAIAANIFRADRLRERYHENILRETILIDTQGEKVGQINGLSVIQLGGFAFGTPSRITARVRLGKGEVIDIEREVELSGPIHSKGVLILSGFLGARYAFEHPLSLSASLVFEQSYNGVEGDSASSAELYALLSAIAEVPIKQSFAVTGSVNQHGQVQAIGGVNEKIEGYYDICEARGLTGDQGVLIPASNVKHLMLRQDVIESVRAEKFHIFPISTIDEGIEVLTGLLAGAPDDAGNYPEGSINAKVQKRLSDLAKKRDEFDRSKRKSGVSDLNPDENNRETKL